MKDAMKDVTTFVKNVVPTNTQMFTTWAWWVSLAVIVLHVLRITPSYVAAGMFPVTLLVLIIGSGMYVKCTTTKVCEQRYYLNYSKKHNFKQNTKPEFDAIISPDNLGTHIMPLLLICLALLTRSSHSTYGQRATIATVFVSIYLLHGYFIGPNITDSYHNIPQNWAILLIIATLLASLIPV